MMPFTDKGEMRGRMEFEFNSWRGIMCRSLEYQRLLSIFPPFLAVRLPFTHWLPLLTPLISSSYASSFTQSFRFSVELVPQIANLNISWSPICLSLSLSLSYPQTSFALHVKGFLEIVWISCSSVVAEGVFVFVSASLSISLYFFTVKSVWDEEDVCWILKLSISSWLLEWMMMRRVWHCIVFAH